MFVVVVFSGGGARSAALGYGVLEELARNKFVAQGKSARLFGDVDMVYGVSGGSILAAYYGLHGEGALDDFGDRFLNLDFQDKIIGRVISLSNQLRLSSPRFGRSDLLEEQLDMKTMIGSQAVERDFRLEEMEKLVVIVVNAQNDPEHLIDQSADVPGLRDVVRAISDIPIARYTQESERAMQSGIDRWRASAQTRAQQNGTVPPSVYYINIGLKNLADEGKREELLNVPTSLYLPKKTISELRAAATALMHESPDFLKLLEDIKAQRSD